MVVQITGFHSFPGPGVKTLQAGLAIHRPFQIAAQAAVTVKGTVKVKGCQIGGQPLGLAGPDLWPPFQPTFETTAPDHFFDEFFRVFRAMRP